MTGQEVPREGLPAPQSRADLSRNLGSVLLCAFPKSPEIRESRVLAGRAGAILARRAPIQSCQTVENPDRLQGKKIIFKISNSTEKLKK